MFWCSACRLRLRDLRGCPPFPSARASGSLLHHSGTGRRVRERGTASGDDLVLEVVVGSNGLGAVAALVKGAEGALQSAGVHSVGKAHKLPLHLVPAELKWIPGPSTVQSEVIELQSRRQSTTAYATPQMGNFGRN